jgi:hypothetical protein
VKWEWQGNRLVFHKEPQIPGGNLYAWIRCTGIGYKVFEERGDRDFAFHRQRKAAGLGLAPPLWEGASKRFPATTHLGCPAYGLVTRLANRSRPVPKYAMIALAEALKRAFPPHGIWDLSSSNVGWWMGQPVCIDFGSEGFGPMLDGSSRGYYS